MGFIGGTLGYRILRAIAPSEPTYMEGSSYSGLSKVEVLLGKELWKEIRGKTVLDFGCGTGAEAIEIAQRGARWVYGIDILDRWLKIAQQNATAADCRNVTFGRTVPELVDIIISIDSFEHFSDPSSVLENMARLLKTDGYVLASFGPTWYHPFGGHLFSVFPWAHLLFSERALCRWRSHIRSDGAKSFSEVDGGLNQMTIGRFEKLIASSPFRFEEIHAIPIRRARMLHSRLTREFLTAVVRCKLTLKSAQKLDRLQARRAA